MNSSFSTKHRLWAFTLSCGLLMTTASCEKKQAVDPALPTPTATNHGFLRFSSSESLKSAVKELANSKDKSGKLEALRYAAGVTTIGEFHSLSQVKEGSKNILPVKVTKATVAARGTASDPVEGFDELVPDASFATVLNEDLQVQVGDKFIQITPEGTYYTDALNNEALAIMLADTSADLSDHSEEVKIGDYLYRVDEDVYRYDTYGEAASRLLPIDSPDYDPGDPTGGGPTGGTPTGTGGTPTGGNPPPFPLTTCGIIQPSSNLPTALPSGAYCSFPSYGYGSHTVVGGILQGIFGANSDRTENFNSDHRVKVKLYNFNYFVYSSIGLKVKFQKKGWTGIWDARDTEKLVIGWDALVFETPQVYSAPVPYNVPSFPGSKVGQVIGNETFKFINFDVVANTLSQLDQTILGRDIYNANKVEGLLKNAVNNKLSDITKDVWTYAEGQLAPNQIAFRNSVTKGFRMIYPDKFVLALSRWEKTRDNDQEIDCLLDFNTCRLTYSGNIAGDFNFARDIVGPTYSNKSYSYTLKKASVYGAAKYNGQWKGVRIIQE